MSDLQKSGSFPPGMGWIPLTVGIVIALLLSAIAFTPQFGSRVVVDQTKGGGGAGPNGVDASQDPNGLGGQSSVLVHGPGGQGAIAGKAGTGASTAVVKGSKGSVAGCTSATNGGSTADGVTGTEIHVASTIVTDGIAKDFLGEAQDGIQAAINEVNNSGGICGRRVTFQSVNDSWQSSVGENYIKSWIQGHQVFALVAQPDSEGLGAAIDAGIIRDSGMPVVGSDGLRRDQYNDPWVWPVASSSVSNMHIIAEYEKSQGHTNFGIVFDRQYRFGDEGAKAFAAEVQRVGGTIGGSTCAQGYCGIDPNNPASFGNAITDFNGYCKNKCDAVVMLLEPAPMEQWMKQEGSDKSWFKRLYGGEPLFDDKVANNCEGCGNAPMYVWTGYRPAISPFDASPAVAKYASSLHAVQPNDDAHNEFTEGAYIGTKMFLAACQKLGDAHVPLTRENLQAALNTNQFDFGLTPQPLDYGGGALPHIANSSMALFKENYFGGFSGWGYQNTDFVPDKSRGRDLN
jgi:ABC-type branched-subunit amino acid transport system substrate-binding protein